MVERLANSDDLDGLLDLYRHLHEVDDPLPEVETLQSVWAQFFEDGGPRCFLITDSSQIVASCVLSIIPNLTRGCRPYGLIENVVTRTEFRGRGLGRKVLSNALDFAQESNCYKVMLMTGRKDDRTLAFYESAGFSKDLKTAFIKRMQNANSTLS